MNKLNSELSKVGPNLIFRKAKQARKSVYEYASKKIKVPEIKGEPLFGIHSVLEALRSERRHIYGAFMKKSMKKRAETDERVAEILEQFKYKSIDVQYLTADQLDRITEFQLHNGICMSVTPLEFTPYKFNQLAVFIDRVLDPGNVGAIGRTAWYFGADGLTFVKSRGPKSITPAMSKASCGALEHLPIDTVDRFDMFKQKVRENQGELVATCDPSAVERLGLKQAIRLHEWKPTRNVAIVLGDEGVGIGSNILKQCDTVVTIPKRREQCSNISSLNVSVVAALMMHHVSTSRQ